MDTAKDPAPLRHRGIQEYPICRHIRHDACPSRIRGNVEQLRMEEWLATAEGKREDIHIRESVNDGFGQIQGHILDGLINSLGIATPASKVASIGNTHVNVKRRGEQPLSEVAG
jgi:hypothetical protein